MNSRFFTVSALLVLLCSAVTVQGIQSSDSNLASFEEQRAELKTAFYTGTAKLVLIHSLLLPVEYKLHDYIATWLYAELGREKPEMGVILGRTIGYNVADLIMGIYNRYQLWKKESFELDMREASSELKLQIDDYVDDIIKNAVRNAMDSFVQAT